MTDDCRTPRSQLIVEWVTPDVLRLRRPGGTVRVGTVAHPELIETGRVGLDPSGMVTVERTPDMVWDFDVERMGWDAALEEALRRCWSLEECERVADALKFPPKLLRSLIEDWMGTVRQAVEYYRAGVGVLREIDGVQRWDAGMVHWLARTDRDIRRAVELLPDRVELRHVWDIRRLRRRMENAKRATEEGMWLLSRWHRMDMSWVYNGPPSRYWERDVWPEQAKRARP